MKKPLSFGLSLATFACLGIFVAGCAPSSSSSDDASDDAVSPPSNDEVVSGDDGAITPQNFLTHPRIVAVRKVTEEIDAAIRDEKATKSRKDDICETIGEVYREKFVDEAGHVRKLVLAAGSDDAWGTTTFYYAADGTVRFAFDQSADVRGGASDARIYFDEKGTRIFEVHREAHSPNGEAPRLEGRPYTVPPASDALRLDPEAEKNPAKAFDAEPKCG